MNKQALEAQKKVHKFGKIRTAKLWLRSSENAKHRNVRYNKNVKCRIII